MLRIVFIAVLFTTVIFRNPLYAQSNMGEQRIDSIINEVHSSVTSSPNYLVYYIEGAWIAGPIICYINLDSGSLEYFKMATSNVEKKRALKRKEFKKVKSLVANLHGVKQSIVNMDDGCEGKIFVYRDNKLYYSHYFLGLVPEGINDLSKLLNSL